MRGVDRLRIPDDAFNEAGKEGGWGEPTEIINFTLFPPQHLSTETAFMDDATTRINCEMPEEITFCDRRNEESDWMSDRNCLFYVREDPLWRIEKFIYIVIWD